MPRLRTWRSQGSHSSETWTQCINQLSNWYGTTFRKKSRKLFIGRDLILMKLKPHVSLAGSSTNSTFRVILSTRGPKITQAWQKSIAGLGSNTFYQIQIQIQIQKFRFFKYKYKYKYFAQLWFKYKYKYKYIDSNTNTNTFNQIYLPKLFGSEIGQFYKSQNICSWSVFPNV